jgi:magnesium transporter
VLEETSQAPDRRTPRALLYDAADTDEPVSLVDVDVDALTSRQLLWIDVSGDEDLARAAAALELEPETIAAIQGRSTEPEIQVNDEYVHVVVSAVPGNGPAGSGALHCLAGANWVLTAHERPLEFLEDIDGRIHGDSELGKLDAHGFLAAVLQEHVASYLAALRPIEAELDLVDVRSMTGRMDEDALLRDLVTTRLQVARLRRALEPHREVYARLARADFAVLSGARSLADFQSLNEFLERTLRSMEATREMITGSFEIYTTWTAHRTNQLIKRLTIASVTLLPPTLLAGIMGMNSLPAAFTTGAVFSITTAGMALLVVSVLAVARARDWL